jgi:prepilin-type N-terminal cleavage/methylation domain-containing protein
MVAHGDLKHGEKISRREGGFSLAELMISLAVFSFVSLGLLMGFVSLQRNYSATTDFALSHGDQMRVSDYMAMDFRRALAVPSLQPNDALIDIPVYYDGDNAPTTPTLNGTGGVYYGTLDGSGNVQIVRVHYYLQNGSIYRQQGSGPAVVLATSVNAFNFPSVAIPDQGKVVKTLITFKPKFASETNPTVINETAFYNTTLLRNKIY